MKIELSIDDKEMKYSYEIGSSRRAGSMLLCEDSLLIFTSILEYLNKLTMNFKTERHKAFEAYVFTKAHPDLIADVEKQMEKKV